jgi:putative membrane-bound dehydrogenase-like protein
MHIHRTILASIAIAALIHAVNAQEKPDEKISRNMTPEETVKAMELADGFKMSVFAGEPDVRQPCAFCLDDRGRLWVGENYTYTKYGWSPDDRDQILIFDDTDGDGKFDKRTVFTDKITYVSGLEVGHGGVWVGSIPNLLFIPDKNKDDVPDGEPEIVLDGWGKEDQHETLNSFNWGPDGWLYGCHGVFVNSKVGKPSNEQPLGHRLGRQRPNADDRLRDSAPVARDSGRPLSPPGRDPF